ncbi:MAG: DUF5615 family PIN-like protein [Promethearchaeota archaeon]
MKFLTDAMLGKLTRFLRIFGYDTVYANELIEFFHLDPVPDENLIEYAKRNSRLIITKDYGLYKHYTENSIFLNGKGIYNYLKQLNNKLGLKFQFNLKQARCSICNSQLNRVENKILIKNLVLEETFNNYSDFYQCSNPRCGKIFWRGSHIEDIEEKMRNTL